jgi:DNA-binding PadR family transcriptional regulator
MRRHRDLFPGPFRDFASRFVHEFARGRHGRHGFGGFAGGFADDAVGGGRGFRSGRKLSSKDLQLVILALIEEKPRHGYEIIKALDDLSHGFYVPSPGIVYPSLTYLEEAGYAVVAAEGARKLYRLTTEGRSYLAENRDTVDATISQIERAGVTMERLREAVVEDHPGRRGRHGRHRHGRGFDDAETALGRSRAALKSALFDVRGATGEEEKLIADILDRATAEIRAIRSKGKA